MSAPLPPCHQEHASALGHSEVTDLLRAIFTDPRDPAVKCFGVSVVERPHPVLSSLLSMGRGTRLISPAGMGEVYSDRSDDDDDNEMLGHTGYVRVPNADGKERMVSLGAALRVSGAETTADGNLVVVTNGGAQREVREGDVLQGHVYDYGDRGDGGDPLLTVSLEPPRRPMAAAVRRGASERRALARGAEREEAGDLSDLDGDEVEDIVGTTKRRLSTLRVGDGPLRGRIVRLSTRAGAAFVDVGVVRKVGKARGGGVGKVLGMLRFDDADAAAAEMEDSDDDDEEEEEEAGGIDLLAGLDLTADVPDVPDVEDTVDMTDDLEERLAKRLADIGAMEEDDGDDTTEEDISDQLVFGDDGLVTLVDPVTGERKVLNAGANDEEDDDEEFDEDSDEEFDEDEDQDGKNPWGLLSPSERAAAFEHLISRLDGEPSGRSKKRKRQESPARRKLREGAEIDLYVKQVSLQSGRFKLTTDPHVGQSSGRDRKRDAAVDKRMEKLTSILGEEGLADYIAMEGEDGTGTVVARSKTGSWYYVRPNPKVHGDLPVGVAAVADDGGEDFMPGDVVRIRFAGIDESRGQIAMDLVGGG